MIGQTLNLIEQALALAAEGYPVFPVLQSKAPACPTGFKAAVRDPDGVRQLFRRFPATLIGVPTGGVSGIDALDLDGRHGAGRWWQENRHRIPITRVHRTRSGGLHILFRHHPSVRNTAGRIAPGVDTRGEGGYLIWWPAAGFPVLKDAPPAVWPAWLLEALNPPPAPPPPTETRMPVAANDADQQRRYAVGALRKAIERVATAGEGSRNQTLNTETFSLARFVKVGHLTPAEIADSMACAAIQAGLDPKESIATIASGLRAGGAS